MMQVTGNRASEAYNRSCLLPSGVFFYGCALFPLRGRNFGKMLKIKMQNNFMTRVVWAKSRAPKMGVGSLVFTALLFLVPLSNEKAVLGTDKSTEWNLPRGNAQSSGFTPIQLPSDLTILWETKLDEAIETTPVVGHGKLFTADIFGKLYALDQDSGELSWKRDYETGFLAAPALNGKKMVIGDVDGNVYALNPETGEELWRSETGGEISGSAAFFEDMVVIASQDGKLYSFALKDGTPRWTYQTEDQVRCSPSIAGNRTFLGGCDGQLHQVDLRTGKIVGDPLPLGGPTGSTPAILGSKVVLPIMDGLVLAFNWQKQEKLWTYEDIDRLQEYRSSAAITEDFVVVSSQNKQVDALSSDTGELKWSYTLKRRADASPVIAGKDVWIAATDGRLIRLSLNQGSEIWTYEIRGAFLAAPAIINGRLFIGDDDGVMRCFGVLQDAGKEIDQ